jgi:hypothetical protein
MVRSLSTRWSGVTGAAAKIEQRIAQRREALTRLF